MKDETTVGTRYKMEDYGVVPSCKQSLTKCKKEKTDSNKYANRKNGWTTANVLWSIKMSLSGDDLPVCVRRSALHRPRYK